MTILCQRRTTKPKPVTEAIVGHYVTFIWKSKDQGFVAEEKKSQVDERCFRNPSHPQHTGICVRQAEQVRIFLRLIIAEEQGRASRVRLARMSGCEDIAFGSCHVEINVE